MSDYDAEFWQTTPLQDLTQAQWEMLCDGCGKCCLHKLQDEDDGEVYYTDLACHLLDLPSCRCSNYANRHQYMADCIAFTADEVSQMDWLPDTCAYRLRYLGKPLFDWHYLISGSKASIHAAGESVRDFAELHCGQDVQEHIIHFKP